MYQHMSHLCKHSTASQLKVVSGNWEVVHRVDEKTVCPAREGRDNGPTQHNCVTTDALTVSSVDETTNVKAVVSCNERSL